MGQFNSCTINNTIVITIVINTKVVIKSWKIYVS